MFPLPPLFSVFTNNISHSPLESTSETLLVPHDSSAHLVPSPWDVCLLSSSTLHRSPPRNVRRTSSNTAESSISTLSAAHNVPAPDYDDDEDNEREGDGGEESEPEDGVFAFVRLQTGKAPTTGSEGSVLSPFAQPEGTSAQFCNSGGLTTTTEPAS